MQPNYPNLPPVPNQQYQQQPLQQAPQNPQYAPPLHTIPKQQAPQQRGPPPVYTPACIPNPQRVNYQNPSIIRCARNNLCLNVNQVIVNCPINVWTANGTSNQKWYFTNDSYIELASDRTFVLDCVNINVGAQLVLGKKRSSQTGNAVDPAIISQKWNVVAVGNYNYIVNVMNPNFVIELAGSTKNYEKGDLVRVNSNLSVNNTHQQWSIQATYHTGSKKQRLVAYNNKVYVTSAETGLYLTVKTGVLHKGKAGQKVIMAKGRMLGGAKTQQWIFEEDTGMICSALDKNRNLVLDCGSGQAGQELTLATKLYSNNLSQKFIIKQCTGIAIKKDLNMKVCRYLYSQLNSNLVIDEKGKDEAAFVNFSRQSPGDGKQKWKFKTA